MFVASCILLISCREQTGQYFQSFVYVLEQVRMSKALYRLRNNIPLN